MGLDTSWTDAHPVTALAKPVEKVVTKGMDTYQNVKISNNNREIQFDNNRLAAYQTKSNNALTAFTTLLNTGLSVVTGLISVVNTAMQTYAQVKESNEQTRRVQIQAGVYIQGKREETRQIQIQQEWESFRYLATLKKDLEVKQMDLQKFEKELDERRDAREFSQEQWRRKVTFFENLLNPMLEQAKKIREAFCQSNFDDEKLWDKLNQLDKKIHAYSLQINEIYN